MQMSRFCRRLLRASVRMSSLCLTLPRLAQLSIIKHLLRTPITQQGGLVVSLHELSASNKHSACHIPSTYKAQAFRGNRIGLYGNP